MINRWSWINLMGKGWMKKRKLKWKSKRSIIPLHFCTASGCFGFKWFLVLILILWIKHSLTHIFGPIIFLFTLFYILVSKWLFKREFDRKNRYLQKVKSFSWVGTSKTQIVKIKRGFWAIYVLVFAKLINFKKLWVLALIVLRFHKLVAQVFFNLKPSARPCRGMPF